MNFPMTPLLVSNTACTPRHSHCPASTRKTCDTSVARRSANYKPSIWGFDFIQSLKSDYKEEMCERRAKKLEHVRSMINTEDVGPLDRLEMIDDLGRLGVGYLFEKEIKRALDLIATENYLAGAEESLHAVALRFRLLRQYGYEIPQDVFSAFKDNAGSFKASLCEDVRGMLSLYEASHLAIEGENLLDAAKDFTSKHLKNINRYSIAPSLEKLVNHSLELPLHWRTLRTEARWYIEVCTKENYINLDILELAKLDFNMVQVAHQKELRDLLMWWRDLGLCTHSELKFARDRLTECFLWIVGTVFEPQFDYCRKACTKLAILITMIDDVYDIYGSLDELKLFTNVVERWDTNKMEQLPNYMKLCFLSLHNTSNELAYDSLKKHGWNVLAYLKKAWADLCKAYLVEAEWYNNKYTPTLEEYLNNAWISVSAPLVMISAYFLVTQEITKEQLECIESYPDIIRSSAMIIRLCDDLATSTDELQRGDVPKSIQCYMHETGFSEEVACEHIRHLISETWKKMNKDRVHDSLFNENFIGIAVNVARGGQCIYHYGDGFGATNQETKDEVLSLFVEPIPLMTE